MVINATCACKRAWLGTAVPQGGWILGGIDLAAGVLVRLVDSAYQGVRHERKGGEGNDDGWNMRDVHASTWPERKTKGLKKS